MMQVIYSIIVPMMPNLAYPHGEDCRLVHIHISTHSEEWEVEDRLSGKPILWGTIHPDIQRSIEEHVAQSLAEVHWKLFKQDPDLTYTANTFPTGDDSGRRQS